MSFWDFAKEAGAIAGGIAYGDLISDRGQQYADQMGTLAGQLQDDAAFKGYGVKTGLGETTVAADGSVDMSAVGPDANMQAQAAGMIGNPYRSLGHQAAQNAMGFDQQAREQGIYNRAMAMQQPQLDAQRAAGNAQEYAMGRGGVMGSQFGGSGEDAAMARAQAQAQNAAAFQSMGQAQAEQAQMAGMANTFGNLGFQGIQAGQNQYAQSYMPMNQQMAAMGLGQANAGMAQTGQLTGTGYASQLGLGGIQAAVNADKAGSELYGNIIGAMLTGGGNQGASDGASGLWDTIKGWF